MKPFLSVGIPTFQRPARLRFLLERLAVQEGLRPEEWEVVVSDNSPGTESQNVVQEFLGKIPQLRYSRNLENIGGDRNIRSVFDKGSGTYVWSIPDDDWPSSNSSLRLLIDKIQSWKELPAFVLLNAKVIELDTGRVIREVLNPVRGDVHFSDGRDIINLVDDNDLIGVQRFVIRRDCLPLGFADGKFRLYVHPIAMAMDASAKGTALYIGEPLTVFGDGDPTSWRVHAADIVLQRMPAVLKEAVVALGYEAESVERIIERKKINGVLTLLRPDYLLFQRFGIRWRKLATYYGVGWVFWLVLKNIVLLFAKGLRKVLRSGLGHERVKKR